MKEGLILLALGFALATSGCTSNPQTNKELKCAGGVLGGAAVGGLLGNQIGGGTGKKHRDRGRRRRGRGGGNPGAGLPVIRSGRPATRARRAGLPLAPLRIDSRGRPAVNRGAPASAGDAETPGGCKMADLIAVVFPTEAKAEEVRQKILGMQKDYLIDIGDAVIATKTEDGKVKLNQLLNTTAAGAAGRQLLGPADRRAVPEPAARRRRRRRQRRGRRRADRRRASTTSS